MSRRLPEGRGGALSGAKPARVDDVTTGARRIWVLAGDKPGDNAQCLALADALGWPTEVKQLRYHELGRATLRPFGDKRFALDVATSSPLEPPWPDLVIGCGRRSVDVAHDIRARAGAATRLVQIGRPRADLDQFDLIVTTPQYRLPERANVLHLALPLHRADQDARARAAAEWAPRFAHLPAPRIAVLVGGSAKPFVFDVPAARQLAADVSALAHAEGGSLLISTSRRTPPDAARTLADGLTVPAYVHHWSPGGGPNPYLAYLALADALVATGDSASMLAEACSTGKRVWFVELPKRRTVRSHAKNLLRRVLLAPSTRVDADSNVVARWLSDVPARGWVRYPRDLRLLHAALAKQGRALPLGTAFTTPPPPPLDEKALAATRVRRLF